MSEEAWRFPDVERLIGARLAEGFTDRAGIGTQLPSDWSPRSTPFLRIALDGVPRSDWPIAAYATVRVIAHASDIDAAKNLALDAEAWLLGTSTNDLSRVQPLTGLLPSTDPHNGAAIASFTVRATCRYRRVVLGG